MVKLQYDQNKQYKITLPKALVEALGWAKGTGLKVGLDRDGSIRLTRKDESKGEVSG